MSDLAGMTQEKWDRLSPRERAEMVDKSGLSPQLRGHEGYRVEVQDEAGDRPRRFIVGKSTGWRPCHLEIKTRRSLGGDPAAKVYSTVRVLEKVR